SHALELVGRQDGSTLQTALQGLTVNEEVARVGGGDHAGVVGEFALDQLGDQFDLAKAEANLGGGNINLHHVFAISQQTLHFQHSLAGHDDVVARLNAFHGSTAMRQTVAVGGHGTHGARLEHEQQAVQVIANVLLRHGKVDLIEQVLERFLRQREGHIPGVGY